MLDSTIRDVAAMKRVNLHQAKTELSRLFAAVERGREVVITRNGTPVATRDHLGAVHLQGLAVHAALHSLIRSSMSVIPPARPEKRG